MEAMLDELESKVGMINQEVTLLEKKV